MDVLTGFLYVLVGVAVGGLMAVLADAYFLGRRLRQSAAEKRELQESLRGVESLLARSEVSRQKLAGELEFISETTAKEAAEVETLQEALELAQAELATEQENLQRVNNYTEELHESKLALQQELAVTEAKLETSSEHLDRLQGELDRILQKHEDVCRRLGAAEVEIKHLQAGERASQKQDQTAPEATTAETNVAKVDVERDAAAEADAVTEEVASAGGADISAEAVPEDSQEPRMEPEEARQQVKVAVEEGKSQIEAVHGIGPVYAERLREAGIVTLNDLASETPEHVSEIVGLKSHDSKPVAWIEEAQDLASAVSDGESPAVTSDPQPATDRSQTG